MVYNKHNANRVKSGNSQEWVLAQFRRDEAKNDPPFYSIKQFFGETFIWLNVIGNVGWYWPEIKDGKMIGLRSMAQPLPHHFPEDSRAYRIQNYYFKWISPKQRAKIEQACKVPKISS